MPVTGSNVTVGNVPGHPVTTPPADDASAAVTARRARRRQEMVEAATAVIRTHGPDASMEQIAAGCGITKPILYRTFGDRAGLIEAMGIAFVADLVLDLADALRSDGEPDQVLRRAIESYVRHLEADPQLYRFLVQEAPQGGIRFLAGLVAEEVARVLTDRFGGGDLPADRVQIWAHGLVGMVHFAGDWWVTRRAVPRRELVDGLCTLAWVGLAGAGLGDAPTVDAGRSLHSP